MLKSTLTLNSDKCIGCRLCELFCSFKHKNTFSRNANHIRIVTNQYHATYEIQLCDHCESKECLAICSDQAITYNAAEDRVQIERDNCTLCMNCSDLKCNGVIFRDHNEAPFICDLCDNQPICAEVCPTEAITFPV